MSNRSKKTQSGRLRIVAGIWRGRLLQIADVEGLRPTSARIRETLFNWLAPRVHGSVCLDLCAGSGALGLEALSRGAAEVVFVEKSRAVERQLRSNIEALQAESASVVVADASDYLRSGSEKSFDIIFLDPPFADDMLQELCRLLAMSQVLAPRALVYLELDVAQSIPELPMHWAVTKNKTAGGVRYMLVETSVNEEQGK